MSKRNRNQMNRMSPQKQGNPSDLGKAKAEVKLGKEDDSLSREDEIKDKYMSSEDEAAANVRKLNPNRNTDKPDIDKPAY